MGFVGGHPDRMDQAADGLGRIHERVDGMADAAANAVRSAADAASSIAKFAPGARASAGGIKALLADLANDVQMHQQSTSRQATALRKATGGNRP